MKKILFLVQILIAFSLNAQNYKYTSANLNLRSGPSTIYKVLTVIPVGTSVEMAEDCDCEWIKVIYNGNVGYVSSKFLTKEKQSISSVKYYTNSKGQKVQSPTYYNSPPPGATALCRDGTYSFSQSRRGTCSHLGGVAKWLK